MRDRYRRCLGIDFGTTHTVAVIGAADAPAQPLLFDAGPLLSSAVFAEIDGRLLVGSDAERSARLDPARFEPNPKRRIDDGRLLLGQREYQVVDVIAAVLHRVLGEATRVSGSAPSGTVITHPAAWGATRRAVLAEAAARAGIGNVTLVPEPVAAAVSFTEVLGQRLPPGAVMVVYDFGGGTFDVSVLRSGPGGWEILASDGCDVGGLDLDAALAAHLGTTLASRDAATWHRLSAPVDAAGQRAGQQLRLEVRVAKEQLSRASSAAVHVPMFDIDLHITREEFERIARPYVERTVDLTGSAIQRAGLRSDQVSALVLVGGSSRIPIVATLLHHRFLLAPTVIEQPELVVAQGAARCFPVAPPVAPASLAGLPMTGVPGPVSGVPGPVSGGPGAGVAGPGRQQRRSPAPRSVLLAVIVVVLLCCGVGGTGTWFALNSIQKNDLSGNTVDGGGSTGGSRTSAKPKGAAAKQTVQVDRTVWFAGFKLTFGTAAYDSSRSTAQLSAEVTIENLANDMINYPDQALPILFSAGGANVTGRLAGASTIPGHAKTNARFEFDLPNVSITLAKEQFVLGSGKVVQATIPLDQKAPGFDPMEPKQLVGASKFQIGHLAFDVSGCELRAAYVEKYTQLDRGTRGVWCAFTMRGVGVENAGMTVDNKNFRLRLADGTTNGPGHLEPCCTAFYPNDAPVTGWVEYAVPWPAKKGTYAVQFSDLGWLGGDPVTDQNTHDVTFTL